MAATAIVQGPLNPIKGAAAAGGGTFVAQVDTTVVPFVDRLVRIQFEIYLTQLSGGHLLNACALLAECVVANKNGTVTLLGAVGTSANPVNSNTAGFLLTSRPMAGDAAFTGGALATAVITIAANKVTLTVTNNNGGGIAADVTVLPYVRITGSQ